MKYVVERHFEMRGTRRGGEGVSADPNLSSWLTIADSMIRGSWSLEPVGRTDRKRQGRGFKIWVIERRNVGVEGRPPQSGGLPSLAFL